MDRCLRACSLCIALSSLGLLITACNVGQNDSTDVSVQGNWSGTYTAAGASNAIPVSALVQQDGPAYLFDTTGVVYRLPSFTGSEKLSGSVTAFPAMGYRFADGTSSKHLEMSGTASDEQIAVSLEGGDTPQEGRSGQASLLPFASYFGEPSVLGGQWMGYYLSPTPVSLDLTVLPDGSFSGDDAYGCHLQGQLAELGEHQSLFAVTIQSTGSSPTCGGMLKGLAHENFL